MSNGPISQHRAGTRTVPIRHFRVGEIVVPDQHPADCDRWQVVETDGIYLTLEPTRPSVLRRMRRHARTVRPA